MTLTRLVIVLVAVAALVAAGPALLARGSGLRDDVTSLIDTEGGSGQSAQQISRGEFEVAHGGMKERMLRELVGEPAKRTSAEVEGIELDCWYYGVAGGTGAYQFCFVDGKLASKRRYGGS